MVKILTDKMSKINHKIIIINILYCLYKVLIFKAKYYDLILEELIKLDFQSEYSAKKNVDLYNILNILKSYAQ